MKYILILLCSLAFSLQATSKGSSPQEAVVSINNTETTNIANDEDKLNIDENRKRITKLDEKLKEYERLYKLDTEGDNKRTTVVDTKFKLHEQEYSILKESIESLRNTAWNYLNYITTIFYGVLSLVIALAGIFIWRENSAMKQKLKAEENEIQQQKDFIVKERNEAKQMIVDAKNEIAISLDSLKRRSNILMKMQLGKLDESEIYADIKQLLQFPSFDNYNVLKRLSDSKLLSSKLQKEIEDQLKTYKKRLTIKNKI